MSFREGALFVNSGSRRGHEGFDRARELLIASGLPIKRSELFHDFHDLNRAVQRAVQDGFDLIVLGGGDGTFSAVISHLVNKDVTLGVLPLGTGNAFARDLGIPPRLPEACAIVIKGESCSVDVGTLNEDFFLNVATIGLTTRIARELTREQKRKWGRLVYLASIVKAMPKMHPFEMTLKTENGTLETTALQVVVGNGRYHGGPFLLSPNASIYDGRLDVYVLKSRTKSAFLKMALRLPMGTQGALEDVHAESCRTIQITTSPSLPITIDGESVCFTPVSMGVAPLALRVLVP